MQNDSIEILDRDKKTKYITGKSTANIITAIKYHVPTFL